MSQIGKEKLASLGLPPSFFFSFFFFFKRFAAEVGVVGVGAAAGGGPSAQRYHPESGDVRKSTASGTDCHSFQRGW